MFSAFFKYFSIKVHHGGEFDDDLKNLLKKLHKYFSLILKQFVMVFHLASI